MKEIIKEILFVYIYFLLLNIARKLIWFDLPPSLQFEQHYLIIQYLFNLKNLLYIWKTNQGNKIK